MSEKLKQEIIEFGQVKVPILKGEGKIYYPITCICEKVLLKNSPAIKDLNSKYSEYISKKTINFTGLNGIAQKSIQLTNCMEEVGFKLFIKNSNPRRLNEDQTIGLNLVKEYLGIEIMNKDVVQTINKDKLNTILNEHNIFIKDCILEYLKDKNLEDIKFQQCTKCHKWYPLATNFFLAGKNIGKYNFLPSCKECHSSVKVMYSDKDINQIYYTYGLEDYLIYRDHNTIGIYEHFKKNNLKYPQIIKNHKDYLFVIKYYYENGFLDKDKFTNTYLKEKLDFPHNNKLNINDVYAYIFGEDCKYYPYKYKGFSVDINYKIEDAIIAARNYICENNIDIKNPLKFNYSELLRDARLKRFSNDTLLFAEVFNDYKYPAYKIKCNGVNYWKDKNNRIKNLKYLIEVDMKISIEKIPLYLTKFSLRKKSDTMYNLLHGNKYYNSLYDWVNECYPDKFIEPDFEINPYRCEFDSIEESQIFDILKGKYKNTIYNQRNNERTIEIDRMIPDYILLTNKNTYLIEYFGLYVENKSDNTRIKEYRIKTENKLNKYKLLTNYKCIFIYPKDLENDFEGLNNKINLIA